VLNRQHLFSTSPWTSITNVSANTRQTLKDLANISPYTVPLVAAAYVLSIPLLAAVGIIVSAHISIAFLAHVFIALMLIVSARQMRGMECLVHEASHYNFSRRNKGLNDFMADVLCAWPMLSTVSNYRRSHMDHHRLIGTAADACHQRYIKHSMDQLDRTSRLRFILGVLKKYPYYAVSWLQGIGTDRKAFFSFVV